MMLFSKEKGLLVLSIGFQIFRCKFIQQNIIMTTYMDNGINGVKQNTKSLKCKNMIAML